VAKAVSEDEVKDWKVRTKKLASGISTARMCLRLGQQLEDLLFFIELLKKRMEGSKYKTF
jgi:hypothetical protein